MKRVYDLARGTVRLEICGAEPEKLLNFLAENGIEFWDTSPKDDFCISFTAHASDYAEICDHDGKNGLEVKLVSSRGGKKLSSAAKRRYAFFIGVFLCIILLAASSLFVWKIEIEGNSRVSSSTLLRELNECGVRYGACRLNISSEKVRNEILINEPEIAWLSVNISNSCAKIVVHERIKKPEIVDERSYADIVSDKAGIIEKLCVLEGQPTVSVGDTVSKGETLISGTVTSVTAEERKVRAMGTVTARTWYEISAVTPLYENAKVEKTDSHKKYSFLLGKNRIKFSKDSRNKYDSCDKITKLGKAASDGAFVLPLGILKESYTEYETQLRRIDEDKATQRLKSTLNSELERSINGGAVLNVNYTVSKDDKLLTVTLRAECVEEIGVTNDRENNRS